MNYLDIGIRNTDWSLWWSWISYEGHQYSPSLHRFETDPSISGKNLAALKCKCHLTESILKSIQKVTPQKHKIIVKLKQKTKENWRYTKDQKPRTWHFYSLKNGIQFLKLNS